MLLMTSMVYSSTACTNLMVQQAIQKNSASESQTTETANEASVVAFLGDSLTAGPGLSTKETFPAIIQQKITGAELPWIVQNSGVSGDTTSLALSRLNWALKPNPKVLVVALGSNDGMRGLSLEIMEKNIREIVARAQQRGIKVILIGQKLPLNFPADYRRRFAAVYPRIARQYRIPLVPFMLEGVALNEQFVLEDGVHPNADGAKKIAENVWPVLVSQIENKGKSRRR
jgi:acyl-CoA thioesterase I